MVLLDAPEELEVVAGLALRVLLVIEPGLPQAALQARDLDVLVSVFLLKAALAENVVHGLDHVAL